MSPIVVFILFALFLLIAVPVSVTLGLVAVLPGAFDPSFTASASYVIRSMVGGIDSFPLLAVPMFVLAGILMARGQISKRLFDVFSYFLGKRTAGIPCAVIITCLFYGAISGSAPATVAAVGSMTIPLLIDMGYIRKKPKDWEDFLRLLEVDGYEVKRGKHIALKGRAQKRFIRLDSLGEHYSVEALKTKISHANTRRTNRQPESCDPRKAAPHSVGP